VKSELATFFEVFPEGTIWEQRPGRRGLRRCPVRPGGHPEDQPGRSARAVARDDRAAQSLKEVGFKSLFSLLATYAGRGPDLAPWLKRAEINRDRTCGCSTWQVCGWNLDQGGSIYDDLLVYRRFPDELFVGSGPAPRMLKVLFEKSKGVE